MNLDDTKGTDHFNESSIIIKMMIHELSRTCHSPNSITSMLAKKDLNRRRRPVGIISVPTGSQRKTRPPLQAYEPVEMVQKNRANDSPTKRARNMTDKHRFQVQRMTRCEYRC